MSHNFYKRKPIENTIVGRNASLITQDKTRGNWLQQLGRIDNSKKDPLIEKRLARFNADDERKWLFGGKNTDA